MRSKSVRFLKWTLPVLAVSMSFATLMLHGQQPTVLEMDFTNAQLVPAHWVLKINPDGSGQFDADGGHPADPDATHLWVGDVHRPVQLSASFTEHIFASARARKLFVFPCESHMKVAFQGTKRLSYSGPDGSGACEYNYSKDKEIEALGNSLIAVEYTILSGARMEMLLQHDRLGLDQELDNLTSAAREGNAAEMETIRATLTRIESDDQVMDRARRKARFLLTQAR
jgi:hypothetical protein